MVVFSFLHRLDERRFLGFPIWEFSLHSLARQYGRLFIRRIVLRHPLRTLKGMRAYRRFARRAAWDSGMVRLHDGAAADFRGAAGGAGGAFLVALGFCQKPLSPPCPSGRFTHECAALAREDILTAASESFPAACRECDVRAIGKAALRAGATFYVMTSAAAIARDLFIPTLAHRRFRYGLFLQCPYSMPAMALPLLICGIQAVLVGYDEGDCGDYAQFLLADEGTKAERTFLAPSAHAHVLDFLTGVAAAREAEGRDQPGCFSREGVLYSPARTGLAGPFALG